MFACQSAAHWLRRRIRISVPPGWKFLRRPTCLVRQLALFGHELGNPQRCVRPARALEPLAPVAPQGTIILDGPPDPPRHFFVFFSDRATAEFFNKPRIAVLLAGNDLINEHRATSSQCFLHGGATRFAD